jgi:hypothetical protein
MSTMRRAVPVVGLLGVLCLVAAGCAGPDKTLLDPVASGVLPATAQLMAHGDVADKPLLLVAPGPGQFNFVGNGNVLAVFPVQQGDRVTLNEWTVKARPTTQLSINGASVYSADFRCQDNRFYFIADAPPQVSP